MSRRKSLSCKDLGRAARPPVVNPCHISTYGDEKSSSISVVGASNPWESCIMGSMTNETQRDDSNLVALLIAGACGITLLFGILSTEIFIF